MTTLCSDVPSVVLDSNVVLDWQLFRDPSARSIGDAIRLGAVRWISTAAMRQELEHVLTRPALVGWPGTAMDVFAAWDTWATTLKAPARCDATPLRCSDPDDQKFIDLAIAAGAHTLVSRDKALLKLKKKAVSRHGLLIVAPADWRPHDIM